MPRLFVAIDLPDEHRTALAGLRDDTLSARWTPTEQYHLTLRFIGDVSTDSAARIMPALAEVEGTGFSLQGHGLNVFPSLRRPRVVFAGIDHEPALHTLQRQIEQTLSMIGVNTESKPFHPHVTLARLKQVSSARVRAYLRAHQSFTLDAFEVSRFHLYESILRPEGSLHHRRATFDLRSRT
ncbi:MAG: RNA 2',3'-cyclic phosphodiesterase [Rhodothermales bacterium]